MTKAREEELKKAMGAFAKKWIANLKDTNYTSSMGTLKFKWGTAMVSMVEAPEDSKRDWLVRTWKVSYNNGKIDFTKYEILAGDSK